MKHAKYRHWQMWLTVLVLICCLAACTPSGKGGSDDAAPQPSQETAASDTESPEIEIPDAAPEGESTDGEEAPDTSKSEVETASEETATLENAVDPDGIAQPGNDIIIHENGDIELPEIP